MENPPKEATAALPLLAKIRTFWTGKNLDPAKLNAAADSIARRAIEDPTLQYGHTFLEIFGE
jgi:hypothetical protein